MKFGEREQAMLKTLLDEFMSEPTHPRYGCIIQTEMAITLPKVFIWCPLKHYNIKVLCPKHNVPMVFHCWTSNVNADSFRQPRFVYDLYGNTVLVQAIYRCPNTNQFGSSLHHEYHSASKDIPAVLPSEITQKFPFKLFYRSACSIDLLDYVIVHIGRGHNFLELSEDIASLNFRTFIRHSSISNDENEYYSNTMYSSPSNDQLMHIFLSYFDQVKGILENEVAATPCSILTCDHTFKVSKHIG
jgi:hypothetical protein